MKTIRHRNQLRLPIRQFVVKGDGFGDYEVQAGSRSQARWKAFRAASDAGYFRSGFRAFLQHGFTVYERNVRRPE